MQSERKRLNQVLSKCVIDDGWIPVATCGNQFDLSQIDISLQWDIEGTLAIRKFVKYHTRDDLLKALTTSNPHAIQVGGILPNLPLTNRDDRGGEDPDRVSRERERDMCRDALISCKGPFVMDIDLTDYQRSEVCECQKDPAIKKCCNACFGVFMTPAMHIIDYILRDVFGMSKFFFVWSGRRGIHVWVFDARVIDWTADQRASFIKRISEENMREDANIHAILRKCALNTPFHHTSLNGLYQHLYPKFDVEVWYNSRVDKDEW
jgi:hypothetical protein